MLTSNTTFQYFGVKFSFITTLGVIRLQEDELTNLTGGNYVY